MTIYRAFFSNGDDDLVYDLESDNLEEAYNTLSVSRAVFNKIPAGYFLVTIKPKHGGSRPGAGRKSEGKPPATQPRRVPSYLAGNNNDDWKVNLDKIERLLSLIEDWKTQSQHSSPTSPRWVRMREFLSDVEALSITSLLEN